MANGPENLVLELLRRMDDRLERMEHDLQDIKVRVTAVEEGQAGINRRLDCLDERVERIEKRLDLVEPPR